MREVKPSKRIVVGPEAKNVKRNQKINRRGKK